MKNINVKIYSPLWSQFVSNLLSSHDSLLDSQLISKLNSQVYWKLHKLLNSHLKNNL
jgi:hypothetical protein